MKAKTVTGGRDHIELVPETIEEAADLVFIGTSKFIPSNAVDLVVTPDLRPFFSLRVYVGEPRPAALDAETRDALDRTP